VRVLGISWGGFLGLMYAARYPASLSALAVVGASASRDFMPRADDNAKALAAPGAIHFCSHRDPDAWTILARARPELDVGHVTWRPGHDEIDQQLIGAKRRLVVALDEVGKHDLPLSGPTSKSDPRA